MKAIVCAKYGPPEVLQLAEIAKPVPKGHEVLVKVRAASVNPLDRHRMRGAPLPVRLFLRLFMVRYSDGLLKPKTLLGADIAGRVEAVGPDVTQFKPGDEVFGDITGGGFAEYACAAENQLALKPAKLSFEAAAAAPVVAYTALQGLRDNGQIRPGQTVLINGASGGVGTFAVQIAKSFGAEVTAVCSTRNLELVRSIGADQVMDYTQEDFTQSGRRYDLIFDAAASHSVSDYAQALNPSGTCVVAGFAALRHLLPIMVLGPWVSRGRSKKIGFMGIAKPNQKDLNCIKELLEAGKVVPVIDRCYPLREAAEAMRYLEQGHARGKVIITLGHNGSARPI